MTFVSALLVPLAAALAASPQVPQDTDHLVGRGGRARAVLALDTSGSMDDGALPQYCPAWNTAHQRPPLDDLTKMEMLRAAVLGCATGEDGIFDRWAEKVDFAVVGFGFGSSPRVRTLHGFSRDAVSLEAAVDRLQPEDSTPMTWAMHESGKLHHVTWRDGDTGVNTCDKHFVVLLSDGNPNTPASPPFDYRCDGEVRTVANAEPWGGADYIWDGGLADVSCGLGGDQPVSTYTIGFGAEGSFSADNLQRIANAGGGQYYYAADAGQLGASFDRIFTSIVDRSALHFTSPSVESDGLFSGNFAYVPSFKPLNGEPWVGNLKKYCIAPERLSNGRYATGAGADRCLFKSYDGKKLVTNAEPVDQWTATRDLEVALGGAGERFFHDLWPGAAPNGAIPPGERATAFARRKIFTWREGEPGYVKAVPGTIDRGRRTASGCDGLRTLAHLHGFDPRSFDCAQKEPVNMHDWPIAAMVNSPATILRYGTDCERPGSCVVAVGQNSGMVAFYDAADGRELLGLVPGQFWEDSPVLPYRFTDVIHQPTSRYARIPTVDGGMVLFHDDKDGDGVIEEEAGERAFLVFGLGVLGRGYYFLDVSRAFGAGLDDARNAIYPLLPTEGTWTEHLAGTIAAPAIGRGRFQSGADKAFAAFTSGHVAEAADPLADILRAAGPGSSTTQDVTCAAVAASSGFSSNPNLLCTMPQGYDLAVGPPGLNQRYCPLTFPNAVYIGQLELEWFDLDPGDKLIVEDMQGNPLAPPLEGPASPGQPHLVDFWTGDTSGGGGTGRFCLHVVTDGVDRGGRGFSIRGMKVIKRECAGGACPKHRPFFVAVDLERLNGVTPEAYEGRAEDGSQLLLVTKECGGASSCVDASMDPDLERMTCPISAPPAVYEEGGRVRGFYFGDQCGQLWRVWTDDRGRTWDARVILELNDKLDPRGASPAPAGALRKVFRRVDLVISGCTGGRSIGVYFGTGNLVRPAAFDDLDGAATFTRYHPGRDVYGVVFDGPGLAALGRPATLGEAGSCHGPAGSCLFDATGSVGRARSTAPGFAGWFVALEDDERMLRDPVTIEGVSFFKTYQPVEEPAPCAPGSGLDRIYSVSHCTGDPARGDTNGDGATRPEDREVWQGESDVGGDLFVHAPRDGELIVSQLSPGDEIAADLRPPGANRRGYRLYLWRVPEIF